jgi:hypothetical protein
MKRLAKARNIKSGDGVVLDMKITDLGGGNSIARGGAGCKSHRNHKPGDREPHRGQRWR